MKKYTAFVFRPGTGRTIPQAQVRVKAYPSTEASPNASTFSDDGVTPLAQPFNASAAGLVEFYAPDGQYDIYIEYEDISYKMERMYNYDPTSTSSVSNAVAAAKIVTAQPEAALSGEIVIPSFLGHPEALPASAGDADDEFSTYAGWNELGLDVTSVVEAVDDRLHLKHTVAGTGPIGVYKPFTDPGTDFTLTAKVQFGYHPGMDGALLSGNRPLWGIGLRSTLGEIASVGLRAGTQGISVCVANFDSSSLLSVDAFQSTGNDLFVRIRKSGTDYYFEWSQFGLAWVTVAKIAAASLFPSGTLAQVGLFAYPSFSTEGFIDCYADFIRQV